MDNKKYYFLGFIIIIVTIFLTVGTYQYRAMHRAGSLSQSATTTISSGGINVVGNGNFQIKELPIPKTSPPNLDRPIIVTSSMDDGSKKTFTDNILKLETTLKNDPTSIDNWLTLAINRKIIGDYQGATDIWEFLTKTNPTYFVPFNNLGDIYAYYLKDPVKAEKNYLQAIQLSPDQVFIYRSLYEFYRYVTKDDAKAKAILQQGMTKNPDSSRDLKYLLDNYASSS